MPLEWHELWQLFCYLRGPGAGFGLGCRNPLRFTFFLASASFLCLFSSDIMGWGGRWGWGHVGVIQMSTPIHLQSRTTQRCD